MLVFLGGAAGTTAQAVMACAMACVVAWWGGRPRAHAVGKVGGRDTATLPACILVVGCVGGGCVYQGGGLVFWWPNPVAFCQLRWPTVVNAHQLPKIKVAENMNIEKAKAPPTCLYIYVANRELTILIAQHPVPHLPAPCHLRHSAPQHIVTNCPKNTQHIYIVSHASRPRCSAEGPGVRARTP